jgi:hypothetical protein
VLECFQPGSGEGGAKPDVRTLDQKGAGVGRPLLCARCKHPITTTAARIEVAGSHQHVRFNPHGFEYQFGCFSEAPGCQAASWPSEEFSWFAGYSWEIGRCERCREHLGWRFADAEHAFFGLIFERLADGGSEEEGH